MHNIEIIYTETLGILRNFMNNLNRNDNLDIKKIFEHLESIQKRTIFLINNHFTKDTEIKNLENKLLSELNKQCKTLFTNTDNRDLYVKKLNNNIQRLEWINKAYKINTSGRKYTVGQKEIFYANLGNNIGSEQNGYRPVLILQNNTGNTNGNTTIIAPVTTHQKKIKFDKTKKKYYVDVIRDGKIQRKYLGFYEVPLRIEEQIGLYGFVNVMHLQEIDRKRISGAKVATATDECYNKVINAIIKNIQL